MARSGIGYYTVPEAAKALGVSRSRVYKLLREGQLQCRREGWQYLISARHICEYIQGERKATK
jgi:excisionase family DNA binding protein